MICILSEYTYILAPQAAVVRVEGRQYGVDVYYCQEVQEDAIDAAYITALQVWTMNGLVKDNAPFFFFFFFLARRHLFLSLFECPSPSLHLTASYVLTETSLIPSSINHTYIHTYIHPYPSTDT